MNERHRVPAILNLVAALFVLVQLPPSPVTTITSNGADREIEVLTQPWLFGLVGVSLTTLMFVAAAVLLWRGRPGPAVALSVIGVVTGLYFATGLSLNLDIAGLALSFNTVLLGVVAAAWTLLVYWRQRSMSRTIAPTSS